VANTIRSLLLQQLLLLLLLQMYKFVYGVRITEDKPSA